MLIYLAALQSIPKERYEAAELDGAGLWARFRYITMPSLRPTTFYVMVNMIIGSFNVFIQVMMLTGGNPNGKRPRCSICCMTRRSISSPSARLPPSA